MEDEGPMDTPPAKATKASTTQTPQPDGNPPSTQNPTPGVFKKPQGLPSKKRQQHLKADSKKAEKVKVTTTYAGNTEKYISKQN